MCFINPLFSLTRGVYVGMFQCFFLPGPVHIHAHVCTHTAVSLCSILYMGGALHVPQPRLSVGVLTPSGGPQALGAGLFMASKDWGDVGSVCGTEPALCTSSRAPHGWHCSGLCSSAIFPQRWTWREPSGTWTPQETANWSMHSMARWAKERQTCQQGSSPGLTCCMVQGLLEECHPWQDRS